MSNVSIYPAKGERALVAGRTGTGKTTVMLKLIQPFYRVNQIQILATKEDDKILALKAPIVDTINEVANYSFPEHPVVIYYPRGSELADPEILDAWCEWIYQRKHTVAMIDELTQVVHSTHAPAGFLNLYTRGRSQGDTVLAGTQRPKGIPPIVYTEAENFYKFFLNFKNDRKRVAEFTHPAMINQVADPHGFHYYNPKRGNKVYYVKSL